MRILVLDDSKERITQFKKHLQNHDVWASLEAQEAIDLLDTQEWDLLFLDHDLEQKVMQPSNSESGYAVACWLERHPLRKPKVVVIHSLNPVGAKKMYYALNGSFRIPFVWAKPKTLKKIINLVLDKK